MTPEELSKVLFDLVIQHDQLRRATFASQQVNYQPELQVKQQPALIDTLSSIDVVLERPKQREHGDWTSNIAMRVAKTLQLNPRYLAGVLAAKLAEQPGVRSAEVAGPGFINIRLNAAAAGQLAQTIVNAGANYGQSDSLAGQVINLEFVSANPTGPLHIGHTRWAALGDSIARVMIAAGATVAREYYINDTGAQMKNFGRSVLATLRGEPTPEGGYPGAYIAELAAAVRAQCPEVLTEKDPLLTVTEIAYQVQLAEIKSSLTQFNVNFDVWTSERRFHEQDEQGFSAIDRAVQRLREQGNVYESDDAIWVRTTVFGDDKDRVVRRGSGTHTYFAADAALYLDKGDRGFKHKVYFLGADHHGYIHRLRALAGAAGDDPDRDVEILIGQLVSVNGAKLSKRAGNIIELDDLRSWLGTDALRYTLARFPADSPLTIDPEVLQKHSNDNPVFYVQYAHARTCAVGRNAVSAGVDRSTFAPELLEHETESALLSALQELSRVVARAAELREPHRVARYLEEVAALYHRWYDNCRVLPHGAEPVGDLHRTRLWLNDATRIVLHNGLDLLGVSAPERM